MKFAPTLVSNRLSLTIADVASAPHILAAALASQQQLGDWISFYRQPLSLPLIIEMLQHITERQEQLLHVRYHLSLAQQFIGVVELTNIDWHVPSANIGYWLHSDYVGAGYMTEAVQTLIDYAFHSLHLARLELRCDELNERSRAVAERLSFRYEGTLRHHMRSADDMTLSNTVVYSLLPSDDRPS